MGIKEQFKKAVLMLCIMAISITSVRMAKAWHNSKILQSDMYVKSKAMKLLGKTGSCSGEQVRAPSGIQYILTAAHCKPLADESGSIMVETEDHLRMNRRIIAEDPKSDLLLLEGVPNMEGLKIAKDYDMNEDVRTFTHGHGYDTYKTEGKLVQIAPIVVPLFVIELEHPSDCSMPKHKLYDGESFFGPIKICLLAVDEMVTTAKIVPGSSGGMVIDKHGDLVGVVSAGDNNGAFGYLVVLSDINQFLSNY